MSVYIYIFYRVMFILVSIISQYMSNKLRLLPLVHMPFHGRDELNTIKYDDSMPDRKPNRSYQNLIIGFDLHVEPYVAVTVLN